SCGGGGGRGVHPDSSRVLTSSEDRSAILWEVETGHELLQFSHATTVKMAAFNPGGTRIITASDDPLTRIWSTEDGVLRRVLAGHRESVNWVALDRAGKRIATASRDGTARLWDAQSGDNLTALRGHGGAVAMLAFSPDGSRLATASFDKSIKVWSTDPTRSDSLLTSLEAHQLPVEWVEFSPDGRSVLSAGWDSIARVWSIEPRPALKVNQGAQRIVLAAHTRDGRAFVTVTIAGQIDLWDASTGTRLRSLRTLKSPITVATLSYDGSLVASASTDGTVEISALHSGRQYRLSPHHPPVRSVSFSKDNLSLLVANTNGVDIWDVQARQITHTLQFPRGNPISTASLSPDGDLVAIASRDNIIYVRNVQTDVLYELRGHTSPVTTMSFASDSSRLATGSSEDGTLRLWDVSRQEQLLVLEQESGVRSVRMSPDGRLAITTLDNNTVRIWDMQGGRLLRTMRLDLLCRPYNADLNIDGTRSVLTCENHSGYKHWVAAWPLSEEHSAKQIERQICRRIPRVHSEHKSVLNFVCNH
ncbi:MAG: WD40 repeat domain-containing protein, partial [Myxococcota bacterium]